MNIVDEIIKSQHSSLTDYTQPDWELSSILTNLENVACTMGAHLGHKIKMAHNCVLKNDVWIGKNVTISPFCTIIGPVFIGDNSFIGNNTLIRPGTIICENASVGFSCEIKNSVLMEDASVSHSAFIGDSIIGRDTNLGRGFTTSNYKNPVGSPSHIKLETPDGQIQTGLFHLGLVCGQGCNFGCHNVSYPGTVVGHGVQTYPHLPLRGFFPHETIIKAHVEYEMVDIDPVFKNAGKHEPFILQYA